MGWFLEHADPLLKVTIIPRAGGALGFAQYLPKELALYSEEALKDRLCVALGGRVAEEMTFGVVTTGARDDLEKVTKMAYSMTALYGMNARVGRVAFPRDAEQFDKPYSEATARMIDEEVRSLVDACYARTQALLKAHADALKGVAELLLERETIHQGDLERIAGARPFAVSQGVKEYLRTKSFGEGAGKAAAAEEEKEGAEEPTATVAAVPAAGGGGKDAS